MTALQVLRNLCREVRRLEKYFHGFPVELTRELEAGERLVEELDGLTLERRIEEGREG